MRRLFGRQCMWRSVGRKSVAGQVWQHSRNLELKPRGARAEAATVSPQFQARLWQRAVKSRANFRAAGAHAKKARTERYL